eukprot:TRINITY_DN76731_c0_g1_i1.p1 TRINITY_DN76731_c0_g1~~TRINITY_DN76731_c0_g1_i1.p1  ORF type:complete len:383 (+),score=74.75 TRINITY_DN76731_c0_g1_i1:52-1149(+)
MHGFRGLSALPSEPQRQLRVLFAGAAVAAFPALVSWLQRRRRKSLAKAQQGSPGLPELVEELQDLLRSRKPKKISGLTADLHELPPFLPKAFWSKLGDALQPYERPQVAKVSGDRYITLRLDGSGFSKLTRRLGSLGIFESGYSDDFADIMQDCCKSLMAKFNAKCGYTQSDEMTLVIAPASIVRGEQQCHSHGGRVLKLCSLAAAHVTALFNFRVQALCATKGLAYDESLLATFDCRLGHFSTLDQAMALILWRAADCMVNGVSDAVYKCKLPGSKKIMGLCVDDKLKWLAENKMLPLRPHQAYGSFFMNSKRISEGLNPKTGERVPCLRSVVDRLDGNILSLASQDRLFATPDAASEVVNAER